MNVFGERQHPEKFIPMCIKKIRDGETVTIHSDKSKKIPGSRHYIHAEDVSEAILFLLNKKCLVSIKYLPSEKCMNLKNLHLSIRLQLFLDECY